MVDSGLVKGGPSTRDIEGDEPTANQALDSKPRGLWERFNGRTPDTRKSQPGAMWKWLNERVQDQTPPHAPTTAGPAKGDPLYDQKSGGETKGELPRSAFEKVAQGDVKQADAPSRIALPRDAVDGLEQAWTDSKGGTPDAQEHGGNLVRDKYNRYSWRPTKPGKDDTFAADEDDVGKDQSLVGFGHSHPYESGKTDVSFSGDDITGLVSGTTAVDLLISGKTFFVIARTAEFAAMVKNLDDDQTAAFKARMKTCWNSAYSKDPKLSVQERAEVATKKVCEVFHLAYYRGDRSGLDREA